MVPVYGSADYTPSKYVVAITPPGSSSGSRLPQRSSGTIRQPDADDRALAYVNDNGDMHHASADAQLGQVAGPYAFVRSRHVPLE